MLKAALNYARLRRDEQLNRLCEWLSIPSVSTLPEYVPNIQRCAGWTSDFLKEIGLEQVKVHETAGHPILTAEWLDAPGSPTLLLYGHYDVQPVDPLDEWRMPPFQPQNIGGDLYARGAADDKGQLFAMLAALQAYLGTAGRLPVNVKVLIEGEEEITSPNLPGFLRQHQSELGADAVLIADQEMFSPRHPIILYGLRGNICMEVEVRGPGRDLHSGTFGGLVDNPFNVLARLLARLQDDETRRVLIPGFYDRVRPLIEEERRLLAQAPVTEEIALHLTGAPALGGERGFSLAERICARPTLDIHGIAGGFTDQGFKTVIPSRATAKLSIRLVPDQQPDEIARLVEGYLRQLAPPTIKLETRLLGTARPVRIDYTAPAVQAAGEAYRSAFNADPVYFRGGGSVPIVSDLIEVLSQPGQAEIPIVMIGFGLPDDNTHAPNEKLNLDCFYKGVETVIYYLNVIKENSS